MSVKVQLSADRLVVQALRSGVAVLLADQPLFRRYLASWDSAEIDREWARFTARPPVVQGAFARTGDKFPFWSVVLGSESSEEEFLGQFLEADLAAGTYGSQVQGGIEKQGVAVWLQCEHPDETRAHHLLAKAIIRGSVWWLIQQGATTVEYNNAHDLTPEQSYLPDSVFTRMQSWSIGGISVAYQSLPAPKHGVYVHPSWVTVDGHAGGVVVSEP